MHWEHSSQGDLSQTGQPVQEAWYVPLFLQILHETFTATSACLQQQQENPQLTDVFKHTE